MVFSLLVDGRNAAQLLCFHILLHMLLFFSIMKVATNKNIVLLPITQITFNSSSLAPYTIMMQHRLDSVLGLGWQGGRETVLASLLIPATQIRRICALLPPVESNVCQMEIGFRGIEYMAILILAGILNQTLDIFIIILSIRCT